MVLNSLHMTQFTTVREHHNAAIWVDIG